MPAVVADPAGQAAASSSPKPRKLAVGVFVDSRLQPAWVAEAFARVAAADFADIVLIVEMGNPPAGEPLAWKLYNRADRWAFARGEDPGEAVDLPAKVPHRAFLPYSADPARLDPALDLDVAFAVGEVDDTALDGLARYGVWQFWFGEPGGGGQGGAMAGFAEVAGNRPLCSSGLKVRMVPRGVERQAYQSWSRTYPFSPARNREQLLHKTAAFAERALRELHRSGAGWLEQCKPLAHPGAHPGRTTFSESGKRGASLIPGISRIGARLAARGVEKALNVEQWFLAYKFSSRPGTRGAIPPDLAGFTRLMPPKDRYWADPFPVERNGRYYIFFEELPFRAGRAHISMVEVDPQGRASKPVKVLERDYHLSYPFLVEHGGELYMIPESAQAGTVEAYRCVEFPLKWKLERVLMQGVRCVDATFHKGPDRWWMFANAAAPGSRMFDDELHLFHSDSLLGEWEPHRRNPVKSDARCARPAGQLYWRNGALYRPAQICAPLYGSGLSVNRVLRLTPFDYAERQVERILPSSAEGLLGLHTVNRAGDLTVVDAFSRRSRFLP